MGSAQTGDPEPNASPTIGDAETPAPVLLEDMASIVAAPQIAPYAGEIAKGPIKGLAEIMRLFGAGAGVQPSCLMREFHAPQRGGGCGESGAGFSQLLSLRVQFLVESLNLLR